MAINGSALDARLQNKMLLDPKLQLRLSGDEFRSFINLLVWSVSLVSDGVFDANEADMVVRDSCHLGRLVELGLIDQCNDSNLYRIHPDYQQWQSSKAQLDQMAANRERDKERKRMARANAGSEQTAQPEDAWEAVAPF